MAGIIPHLMFVNSLQLACNLLLLLVYGGLAISKSMSSTKKTGSTITNCLHTTKKQNNKSL